MQLSTILTVIVIITAINNHINCDSHNNRNNHKTVRKISNYSISNAIFTNNLTAIKKTKLIHAVRSVQDVYYRMQETRKNVGKTF